MSEKRDGRNDFDFLVGKWTSVQRRLRERLAGCTEWEEFRADLVMRKVLDGLGNFDEITMYREERVMRGGALRLYNPETCEWSIYWASDAGTASIFPPMVGRFEDGRGTFYDHELFQGRHIFCRFLWIVHDHDHCRWEQAFSEDGGQTWETNWTMDYVRVSE